MTKQSKKSEEKFHPIIQMRVELMQEIEEENPEGYGDNLYYQALKRRVEQEKLAMQGKPIQKELMDPSEQSEGEMYQTILTPSRQQDPEETKNGPFIEHYDCGRIHQSGNRLNGKLDGQYLRHFRNGKLWNRMTYNNGDLDGPYEWYYENGQLREKGTFKNGKGRDGDVEMYYQTGQLRFRRVYDMGKRIR